MTRSGRILAHRGAITRSAGGRYTRRAAHVFLLWHEALLPLLWQHRGQGIAIVVSEARDGQYLSDFATSLGYRPLHGSSTRGGARALLARCESSRPGGLWLLRRTGPGARGASSSRGSSQQPSAADAVVVPIHAEADRAWRLHSWDRFMIPKPLARVRITYGRPFEVEPGDAGFAEGVEPALPPSRRDLPRPTHGATRR